MLPDPGAHLFTSFPGSGNTESGKGFEQGSDTIKVMIYLY